MPSLLDQAPSWVSERNKYVVLWHGCTAHDRENIRREGICLTYSRVAIDFGRGFYMTTILRQAQHWAWQRYEAKGVRKEKNVPVVLRFQIEREKLAALKSLSFVLGDYENEDYWSLVQHCRQSRDGRNGRPAKINDHCGPCDDGKNRWYDLVIGPVCANWHQRLALNNVDQISFHTSEAVEILNHAVQSRNQEIFRGDAVERH